MASWILVPSLASLRAEFDHLGPGRDKRSDGVIGDVTHQAGGTSDHLPDEQFSALRGKDGDSINEVHAIDVDNTGPWSGGLTFDQCIQVIVTRHRNGQDGRLQNVIWSRKIWSRSWGWTARAYTGASAHTEHGHFSARYGSGTTGNPEADTRPWGLLALIEGDDDMATITQADFNTRMDTWWSARMSPKAADNPQRTALRVAPWQQEVGHTGVSTHDTLFGVMQALLQQAAGGDVDPAVVAQMVIAGLDPQQIVTAVVAALPVDLAKQTADEIYARLAA